ncbi:MAG TPA: hypothetical protein VMF62_12320 [Acetobacteraceae bacterium]|nr:hypothetical protein [Acetobacteraceae bacterium]
MAFGVPAASSPPSEGGQKYTARVEQDGETSYVVISDAPIGAINEVSLEVYRELIKFYEGKESIGGAKLLDPSGATAARTKIEAGPRGVAVFNSSVPAEVIERGSPAIDLKAKLGRGKVLKVGPRRPGWKQQKGHLPANAGFGDTFAVEKRQGGDAGFRTIGATGWVIPPRRALSPVKWLAYLAARRLSQGG